MHHLNKLLDILSLVYLTKHSWNNSIKEIARCFETRVSIHFNKPDIVLGINEEIIAEYFKAVFFLSFLFKTFLTFSNKE